MALKYPLLCVSHTVSGTATCVIYGDGAERTITVPEGRYWTDPVYSGMTSASDAPDLATQIVYLVEAITGNDWNVQYSSASVPAGIGYQMEVIATGAAQWQTRGGHASTTEPGRKVLARLGWNRLANDPSSGPGDDVTPDNDIVVGIWYQGRGVVASDEEDQTGFAGVNHSADRTAYAHVFGSPLRSVRLSFGAVTGTLARKRALTSGYDVSFERHIAEFLLQGEAVRYYADQAAQHRFVTAAVSATDTSISLSSAISSGTLPNGAMFWLDGERMRLKSGQGTTTLTVWRPEPVAHVKYSPLSTDFVCTYVADAEGGESSIEHFFPKRRAVNQDRWDITASLVRAAA